MEECLDGLERWRYVDMVFPGYLSVLSIRTIARTSFDCVNRLASSPTRSEHSKGAHIDKI